MLSSGWLTAGFMPSGMSSLSFLPYAITNTTVLNRSK